MFCVCSVYAARRQHADDPPVLEEDRALVAVDGELRVHREVLIGVLVDDELLEVVGARDHHLAHAALDEVEDAHRACSPSFSGSVPCRRVRRCSPRARVVARSSSREQSLPMSQAQAPVAQAFPCQHVAAKMAFDPQSQMLSCAFCGAKAPLPAAPPSAQALAGMMSTPAVMPQAPIRDIPIEEGMRMAQKGLGVQVQTIKCSECGATVNVGRASARRRARSAARQQVLGAQTNEGRHPPREPGAVPASPRRTANKRFGEWLGGLWFRPNDLKKMASVKEMGGVYVPFWAFDANVLSRWTAERGYYYYETEPTRRPRTGRRVSATRQVQHTRWEPAAGARSDVYHDVLVCAGRGAPGRPRGEASPPSTPRSSCRTGPSSSAGWRAESYAIDLPARRGDMGQQKMARSRRAGARATSGGDTHRGLVVANDFSGDQLQARALADLDRRLPLQREGLPLPRERADGRGRRRGAVVGVRRSRSSSWVSSRSSPGSWSWSRCCGKH